MLKDKYAFEGQEGQRERQTKRDLLTSELTHKGSESYRQRLHEFDILNRKIRGDEDMTDIVAKNELGKLRAQNRFLENDHSSERQFQAHKQTRELNYKSAEENQIRKFQEALQRQKLEAERDIQHGRNQTELLATNQKARADFGLQGLRNQGELGVQAAKNQSEQALLDRKLLTDLDLQQLRNTGAERVESLRNFGGQNIQSLRNQGELDTMDRRNTGEQAIQNLRNTGALDVEDRKNTGLTNLQNLRNQGELATQGLRNTGEVNIQNLRNTGALDLENVRDLSAQTIQNLRNQGESAIQGLRNTGAMDVQNAKNTSDQAMLGTRIQGDKDLQASKIQGDKDLLRDKAGYDEMSTDQKYAFEKYLLDNKILANNEDRNVKFQEAERIRLAEIENEAQKDKLDFLRKDAQGRKLLAQQAQYKIDYQKELAKEQRDLERIKNQYEIHKDKEKYNFDMQKAMALHGEKKSMLMQILEGAGKAVDMLSTYRSIGQRDAQISSQAAFNRAQIQLQRANLYLGPENREQQNMIGNFLNPRSSRIYTPQQLSDL
jgi:hypothetical protein